MPHCSRSGPEAWLALALAPGLGPRRADALLDAFGSADAVTRASAEALRAAGVSADAAASLLHPDAAALDAALAWAEHDDATILTRDDPDYPPLLAEIASAPVVLFVRGDVALLSEPQLAIVGSRNPTPGGAETTRGFARAIAGLGIVITSGLAAGIDGAAHTGALEAGRTIAVLGTGPDRVYPTAHRALARRIAAEGALVSEFPPGTGPRASHFPQRNRLISALSLGTLVTEAAPRSGSLITARYAVEQGREVFAIPGSIHNPLARGCHGLIRDGAKLVDSVDQLLEELAPQLRGLMQEAEAPARRPAQAVDGTTEQGLDDDYRALLESMGRDPVAPDELVRRTGLPVQSVSSMLLLLELQGLVSCHPGGRYSRLAR